MSDFEVLNVGAPNEWRSHRGGFTPATERDGRRVVDREIKNQFIGMTVNALEPGEQAGYWHTHSEIEEIYFFLSGEGQMGLNDEVIEVGAGTIVRVGQNVLRTWRAKPEATEELRWICVRGGGTELPDFPNDARRDTDTPLPW